MDIAAKASAATRGYRKLKHVSILVSIREFSPSWYVMIAGFKAATVHAALRYANGSLARRPGTRA